jgi:hypothetical protein
MTKQVHAHAGAPHYSCGKGKGGASTCLRLLCSLRIYEVSKAHGDRKKRLRCRLYPGRSVLELSAAGSAHQSAGEAKILGVRTYSHALLTSAATRRLAPSAPDIAAWSAAGALLPDIFPRSPGLRGSESGIAGGSAGASSARRRARRGRSAGRTRRFTPLLRSSPCSRCAPPRGEDARPSWDAPGFSPGVGGPHVRRRTYTREGCAPGSLAVLETAIRRSNLLLGPRPPCAPLHAHRTRGASLGGGTVLLTPLSWLGMRALTSGGNP